MNMNNPAENYQPIRASDRTERARVVATVTELQKRLADAQAKSETAIDPNFARLAYTLGKKLEAAKDNVIAFDKKHRELDARQSSTEAKTAGEKAAKAAAKFEKALLAAASAAAALTADAADLANALDVTDQGIWPSRNSVNDAIRGRIIEVLGGTGGVKLPGYGSVGGRRIESLSTRFSMETK